MFAGPKCRTQLGSGDRLTANAATLLIAPDAILVPENGPGGRAEGLILAMHSAAVRPADIKATLSGRELTTPLRSLSPSGYVRVPRRKTSEHGTLR